MAVARLRGVVERVELAVSSGGRFVVSVRVLSTLPEDLYDAVTPYFPWSANPLAYKMGDDLIDIWVTARDELEAFQLVLGCLEVGGKEPKEQDHAHQG